MISYLLAGPAEEPVSLAEAKAFLRVDGTAEDGLVATLVAAARVHVESVTARALLQQSWRLVLDAWPPGRMLRLPVGPATALLAVRVFDDDDDEHELSLDGFGLQAGIAVSLPAAPDLPSLRDRFSVEIDYVAGAAEVADVPADLKHAMLALVAHWYENRDAVMAAGAGAVVPDGFDRLVAAHRQVRL